MDAHSRGDSCFIAVPTVLTIFITQTQAAPGSLNIDVDGASGGVGFRYAEHGVTLPTRSTSPAATVNFRLRSADVLHSFWTPHSAASATHYKPHQLPRYLRIRHGEQRLERICASIAAPLTRTCASAFFTVTPAHRVVVAGNKCRRGTERLVPPRRREPIPPPREGAVVTRPLVPTPNAGGQAARSHRAAQLGNRRRRGTQPAFRAPKS